MKTIYEAKILLVDDEPLLLQMVKELLISEGYKHIHTAQTVQAAQILFQQNTFNVVILDVGLPDGTGFDLIQIFRQKNTTPVIFLSARDEDENMLLGLGLGADDYITKPFLPQILMLRLKAVLNRTYLQQELQNNVKPVITLGDCIVDLNTNTITGLGETQSFTAKEYIIFEKLYEQNGNIVTGDQLCMAAWGDTLYGYENTLMVHMRRLRKKIEADPSNPIYLKTVRGLGYRLLLGGAL